MRKILHDNRGESIVEVLVSFLMLLIVIGAFTTAIRGANGMMTRAGEIRKQAFVLEQDLQTKLYPGGSDTATDGNTYHFTGDDGGFEIRAKLDYIEATNGSDVTHEFPQYRAVEDTP